MSLSGDIGRKIRDAVEYHRAMASDHRDRADAIDDAWGDRDYQWLASTGVITQREASHMLGASSGRRGR
jgi:hypothetical protein